MHIHRFNVAYGVGKAGVDRLTKDMAVGEKITIFSKYHYRPCTPPPIEPHISRTLQDEPLHRIAMNRCFVLVVYVQYTNVEFASLALAYLMPSFSISVFSR